MQLLNPFRGYSDFFKSGFRSFTNRDRKPSSETSFRAMIDSPPKSTFSDTTERRPRPVTVHVTVQNAPREKAERQRRSSFPSFPSNWFDYQSTTNFSNETTIFLRRDSTSSADSRDSEVWIAEGGLYTVPAINESSDEFSCDPFSSASDAKSVFLPVDSPQDDSVPSTRKRDSFLSFTPSSNRSSIIMFRRERTSSN